MNVTSSIACQPKLLTEGARLSPGLLTMKIEDSYRADESRTEASSSLCSIEAISIRAETMTSVLEEILRSRPVAHLGIDQ